MRWGELAQQDRHRPAPASRVTLPHSTQAVSGLGGRPGCEHDPHQPVADRKTRRFPQRGHSTRLASKRCRRRHSLQRSRSTNSTGAPQIRQAREHLSQRPESDRRTRSTPQCGQRCLTGACEAAQWQRAHRSRSGLATPRPHRRQPRFRRVIGQIGGIDRPRRDVDESLAAAAFLVGAGRAGRSTGVVSTSNRSLGVHSSAVHNAMRVDSLIWLGCLVNNADTDAEDSCNPAFSASSRCSWAPVHTSRWAAAIRSFHLICMLTPVRSVRSVSPRSRAVGVFDEGFRRAHVPHRRCHRPMT